MNGLWFLAVFSPALRFTPLHFVFAPIRFRNRGLCALQPQKWNAVLPIWPRLKCYPVVTRYEEAKRKSGKREETWCLVEAKRSKYEMQFFPIGWCLTDRNRIRKWMACGSWRFSALLYALLRCTSCSLQSGLGTGGLCAPQPQKWNAVLPTWPRWSATLQQRG